MKFGDRVHFMIIHRCKINRDPQTMSNAKVTTPPLTTSTGFAVYTDPEMASITKESEFCNVLSGQLKIHLLLSEKLTLPAGYLFDNPGLWRLLNDHGFYKLLISSATFRLLHLNKKLMQLPS